MRALALSCSWIYLLLRISISSASSYFPDSNIGICGRPYVNSTAPSRVHAEIQSPGYPKGYIGPHHCTLTIILPELSWIAFAPLLFTLVNSETPCADSLTIKNQQKPDDASVLCGSITTYDIMFRDSSLFGIENIDVTFNAQPIAEQDSSQPSSQLPGFIMEYIVADIVHPRQNYNHSKQVVSHGFGYIVSHSDFGYGDSMYDNNINSYFTLTDIEPNTGMEIHLQTFNLDNTGNCTDNLTIIGISTGPYSTDPVVLCGSTHDNTALEVLIPGNSVTFHFQSDGVNASEGFRIQYDIKGYLGLDTSSMGYTEGGVITDVIKVTTSAPGTENTTKIDSNKNRKQTYMYLGIGIGSNVVVAVIVILVVVYIVRRKKRLSRGVNNKTNRSDQAPRTGPLPKSTSSSPENRSKAGSAGGDQCDDESAYYSEIGTVHKKGDEKDMHYASRSICDTNFYHVVEDEPPPVPIIPATAQLTPQHSVDSQVSSGMHSPPPPVVEPVPVISPVIRHSSIVPIQTRSSVASLQPNRVSIASKPTAFSGARTPSDLELPTLQMRPGIAQVHNRQREDFSAVPVHNRQQEEFHAANAYNRLRENPRPASELNRIREDLRLSNQRERYIPPNVAPKPYVPSHKSFGVGYRPPGPRGYHLPYSISDEHDYKDNNNRLNMTAAPGGVRIEYQPHAWRQNHASHRF